jgi:D-threo-aldose 1-dehydrogenase
LEGWQIQRGTAAEKDDLTMPLTAPALNAGQTHLGYGCSQLMGGISRRQSLALLEAAFDAGIRHFDTAPSYGYGQAEGVLGDAMRSRRHQVTITTKFGIAPPPGRSLFGLARRIALPIVKHVPSLKSRLSRAAGGLKARTRFSPDELSASIDASLAALKTDYIDVFLLHEAVAADLNDSLFEALERGVERGKIRGFGIGSEAEAAADVYRRERRFCPVMQFEWSVLSGNMPQYPGSSVITHGALLRNFTQLKGWLDTNPLVGRQWSNALAVDLSDAIVLSRLMLAAARNANPEGLTLFSSRKPQNIRSNAQFMQDHSSLRAAAAFAALVARDVPPTLVRQHSTMALETAPQA